MVLLPESSGNQGYEVLIRGHLDPAWADWLNGWTITLLEDGNTLLTRINSDQAALYGLVIRLRDLNLKLVSISTANLNGRL